MAYLRLMRINDKVPTSGYRSSPWLPVRRAPP